MSIMHFDTTTALQRVNIVNVAGAGITNTTGTSSATAGWEWKSNGTVYKRVNSSSFQYASTTDWIFPRTGFDPADYQVRGERYAGNKIYINDWGTASTVDDGAPGDGWYNLTSDRSFYFTLWTYSTGPTWVNRYATGSFRFEIRSTANPALNVKTSAIDGTTPIIDDSFNFFYVLEVGTE